MVAFSRRVARRISPYWYEIIYLWPQRVPIYASNTGFSPADAEIAAAFPYQKHQIQLYAELLKAGRLDRQQLRGQAVLEVCSGLGGGLRYIADFYRPRRLVGVERSFTAARRSRRLGLDVRRAVAERLPFAAATFDCVLCVDSLNVVIEGRGSLREMARVLKPDGRILNADFMPGPIVHAAVRLADWADSAGLEIVEFCDVTRNARQAIIDDLPRNQAIFETVPKIFRQFGLKALTLPGSERYRRWEVGEFSYYLAALKHRTGDGHPLVRDRLLALVGKESAAADNSPRETDDDFSR